MEGVGSCNNGLGGAAHHDVAVGAGDPEFARLTVCIPAAGFHVVFLFLFLWLWHCFGHLLLALRRWRVVRLRRLAVDSGLGCGRGLFGY